MQQELQSQKSFVGIIWNFDYVFYFLMMSFVLNVIIGIMKQSLLVLSNILDLGKLS